MTKEELDVAITALEGTSRSIDNWVLLCAIGVAISLALEVVFSVAHWKNEKQLRPLRAEQSRLNELEIAKLRNNTVLLSVTLEDTKRRSLEAQSALENLRVCPERSCWIA